MRETCAHLSIYIYIYISSREKYAVRGSFDVNYYGPRRVPTRSVAAGVSRHLYAVPPLPWSPLSGVVLSRLPPVLRHPLRGRDRHAA